MALALAIPTLGTAYPVEAPQLLDVQMDHLTRTSAHVAPPR